MKVLVLGGDGMLGHKVFQVFREKTETWVTFRAGSAEWGHHPLYSGVTGVVEAPVDAQCFESVARAISGVHPDVVVNCIGVVKQIAAGHDPIVTIEIDALFPHRLAELCTASGSRLIHISTDCVFSGARGSYTETDQSDADDLYGRAKRLGEVVGPGMLTLRTSIIGRELARSGSLLEWFLARAGSSVSGYRGAIFSGFPTIVFARILADVVERHPGLSGLYHVASAPISKYDLLLRFKQAFDLAVDIVPRDEPRCDRSLDASRFCAATGFSVASWDGLIGELAADPTPYDHWREWNATARR